MPQSGSAENPFLPIGPEGVNLQHILDMAPEMAEEIAKVITHGDEAQKTGFYRGFMLKTIDAKKMPVGIDYPGEVAMSAFSQGKEVRNFIEGLHRGMLEGYYGWKRADLFNDNIDPSFNRAYLLGFSIGESAKHEGLRGEKGPKPFQQFLSDIGISIVGEQVVTGSSTNLNSQTGRNTMSDTNGSSNNSGTPNGTTSGNSAAPVNNQTATTSAVQTVEQKKSWPWKKIGKITGITAAAMASLGLSYFAGGVMAVKKERRAALLDDVAKA